MDLVNLLAQAKASIVDVRESFEFQNGHAQGAVNIPLSSLMRRVEEFRQMGTPIIVYCHSGNRSEQARLLLQAKGIKEVYNGGGLADMLQIQARVAKAA